MISEAWRKMLPHEQNEYIAKILGVDRTTWLDGQRYYDGENYVEDLNAMHKARNTMDDDQRIELTEHLREIMGIGIVQPDARQSAGVSLPEVDRLLHATAAQWAEAFVLAMAS